MTVTFSMDYNGNDEFERTQSPQTMNKPQIVHHDTGYEPSNYCPYPEDDDYSSLIYSTDSMHRRAPSRSSYASSLDRPLPYPKDDSPFLLENDLHVAPLNTARSASIRSGTPSSLSGRGMVSQVYDRGTGTITPCNVASEPPPVFRPFVGDAPAECGSPGYDPSLVISSSEGMKEAVQGLRRAMQGLGSDEKALITILSTQNPLQIDEIRRMYREMYNRDLLQDISSETHGRLEGILTNLARGPLLQDVHRLKYAFGSGNYEVLMDVLINRCNPDLEAIKNKFREVFIHETVLYRIGKMQVLSSTGKELCKCILEAQKADEESIVVDDDVMKDVQTIYEAMVLPAQSVFQRTALCEVFTRRSNAQICAVQLAYDLKYNTHLEEQIMKTYEFEDFTRNAMLSILKHARDPVGATARKLIDTMEGRGTSHWFLIDRIIRLHWMEDWTDQRGKTFGKEVLRRIRHKYASSLKRYIEAETLIHGHYKAALLAILPPPEKTMP
ncbi:hypothetical protein KEM56_001820 [Ascosphaera pollenicola]|nr:hypothetical protein KEM56_001820 [Ascosphaera pollenicola]